MDDMISKRAAIDAISTWDKFGVDERGRIVRWRDGLEPYVKLRDVITAIFNTPSAQPYTIHSDGRLWVTVDDIDKVNAVVVDESKSKFCKQFYLDAEPEIIRKPVIGYEGYYEVDNCGRVYALDRVIHVEDHGRSYDKPLIGGIIKQHMHSNGYKIVPLTRDGKTKIVFVHRIVAMAFLANPNKLPCVNHKDEDKTNNFAENLEWCTYQYNNAYGSKPKKHSKRMSGRKLSDEHKQHISDGLKRHWDKIHAERRVVTK